MRDVFMQNEVAGDCLYWGYTAYTWQWIQATGYRLQVTGYRLQVTSRTRLPRHGLHVAVAAGGEGPVQRNV